jgi:hypothetical protein
MEQPESFEKRLERLINEYSLEAGSNTPDFILAEYMNNCLHVFNQALKARDKWYSFEPWNSGPTIIDPPAPQETGNE